MYLGSGFLGSRLSASLIKLIAGEEHQFSARILKISENQTCSSLDLSPKTAQITKRFQTCEPISVILRPKSKKSGFESESGPPF